MRVLLVFCHPVDSSFGAALHSTVIDQLTAAGHEVIDLDLYAERFDPILSRSEHLIYHDVEINRVAVEKYVRQLTDAECLVLLYPSWWYSMPAMLKGYFDKVWLPGVAFDVELDGHVTTERLRHISRIIVITTYGSPWWLIRIYMGDPARKFVSRGLRRLCSPGCKVQWYVKYGMDRASKKELGAFLAKVGAGISKLV